MDFIKDIVVGIGIGDLIPLMMYNLKNMKFMVCWMFRERLAKIGNVSAETIKKYITDQTGK